MSDANWTVMLPVSPSRRNSPLVRETIQSVHRAGWKNPRWQITHEAWTLDTAWPLWKAQLDRALGFRNQTHVLAVQDDVQLAEDLLPWLERELSEPGILGTGAVSLYCPGHYPVQEHGWHQVPTGERQAWGALAIVMTQAVADVIVSYRGDLNGNRAIDACLMETCHRTGLNYYLYAPSLCQHTGEESILHPGSTLGACRRASSFLTRIEAS